jgi:hypothetical protein
VKEQGKDYRLQNKKGNFQGRKRGIKKNKLDCKDEEIKKMIEQKIIETNSKRIKCKTFTVI